MNTTLRPKSRRIGTASLVLLFLGITLGLFCLGIWHCFHASRDLHQLKSSIESSLKCPIQQRFAFNAGSLLFGLVRGGCSFFTVPPEVTAGLQAIHGVETSICRWDHPPKTADYHHVIEMVDRAMETRGWERMVTVVDDGILVLVFNSTKNKSPRDQRFCVAVSQGENLILTSVRGDCNPLIALASKSMKDINISF